MAHKKERIIIAVAEPSLLEGGADKIYPCMTRREAIEIMAKAMFVILPRFSNLECEILAKEALNALLEGGALEKEKELLRRENEKNKKS